MMLTVFCVGATASYTIYDLQKQIEEQKHTNAMLKGSNLKRAGRRLPEKAKTIANGKPSFWGKPGDGVRIEGLKQVLKANGKIVNKTNKFNGKIGTLVANQGSRWQVKIAGIIKEGGEVMSKWRRKTRGISTKFARGTITSVHPDGKTVDIRFSDGTLQTLNVEEFGVTPGGVFKEKFLKQLQYQDYTPAEKAKLGKLWTVPEGKRELSESGAATLDEENIRFLEEKLSKISAEVRPYNLRPTNKELNDESECSEVFDDE